MSLQISDNFSYLGRKPIDARLLCATLNDLNALSANTIYNGIIVYVEEEQAYYGYNKEHETNAAVDAWTKLNFGNNASYEEIEWVVPYTQGATFAKDVLVYYNDSITLVSVDFTSDDTQAQIEDSFNLDIANNKLILLNREAVNMVQPYKQNTYYLKDMLLFADGRVGRVLQDYMSDNTGATIEESINIDIAAGKLREMAESYKFKLYKTTQDMNKTIDAINTLPFSSIVFENGETVNNMHLNEGVYGPLGTLSLIQEIDKNNQVIKTKTVTSREINFMPPAPADHKIIISLPGNNYAVNDIIDSSLDSYSIKITEVDSDGGILAAELIDKTSNLSTNGYGAIIDAYPKKYVANNREWYEYSDVGTSEGIEKPAIVEYTPNTPYLTNTLLCFNNILYRAIVNFTSSNTEADVQSNLNKDIQLGYIARLTPEEQAIPECLGSFATDEPEYFPTEAIKGNWALVLDCTLASPGQPGIALYTDNGWEITPFPKGQMEFPEPLDDGKLYFRSLATGTTTGSWVAFTEADGNEIIINIKSSEDASYVPKKGELVWYDNKMLLGDGTTDLMALSPFYTEALDATGIANILGFTPEDSAKKGQANGYAPLDANGLVPKANLPLEVTDTYSKIEIDDKDAATLLSATTAINTETTRATTKETEIETNLNIHTTDTAIHVTQAEKDGWNAKIDESDLLDYDNHISDTAIHVTQADKDRWDGMNKAYFVTSVNDLPATDNEIGNIGYVQTSAAGVVPIVCDQYLWTGTDWKKIDSSGISLTFNWDNLTGKPSSTPLTIDNAVTIAHNHVNKIALDKIGQSSNGEFTWNGEPIGIQAIFLENENSLPNVGQENTLYIVYEDARVRNFPSISVYRNNAFQILGRGTQDAPPTVGEMSILQVEYFGVQENSTFNVTIAPQTSFCFMPVEILIEQAGQQNVTNNIVSFTEPEKFSYNENLFKISASTKLMFDIKNISTVIDTVGDYYYSHAMVDLADYYDVQGIG